MKTFWVVGLLALASCGVAVQAGTACGPASCSGCCNASGQCVTGVEPAACGLQGQQCERCAAGLSCNSGQCGVLGAGGGLASGGGAAGGGIAMGSNETCAAPLLLTLAPVPGDASKQAATYSGSTVGARDDEGSTLSSCGGAGPDSFFAVDVPEGRVLSVKVVTGGSWRAVVRLRTRVCTEPDDRCATAAPGSTTASLEVAPTQARRYVITVDGADAAQAGAYELQLETRPSTIATDGGSDYCSRLLAAEARFFGAKTRCEDTDGGVAFPREVQESNCRLRLPLCTAQDLPFMNAYLDCYERTTRCLDGQESAAMTSMLACTMPIVSASTSGQLSGTCKDALRR